MQKLNSVNPLYLIINKINGYIEESNGNKYLTLVSANEKIGTIWNKIEDLIRSMTNTSGDYHEKYMKIKLNTDDNIPLNKFLKLHNLTIVVRSVFQEDKKYYQQFFLDECLYEI